MKRATKGEVFQLYNYQALKNPGPRMVTFCLSRYTIWRHQLLTSITK